MNVSYIWVQDVTGYFYFLICVIDSIKGFSRCRGYYNILLSILLCVYICSAASVELPIVLLYLLRCLVYHMLSKTKRNSRSLQRVIAYICYALMLGVSHVVEVLVLGLLVVV